MVRAFAPKACAAGLTTRHSLTLDGSTWLFAAHATKASFSRMCLHALSSFQRTGSPDVSQTPVLLLRAVLPDQRTRCRVRLIGVPTERPFPSVLGEPSKVTTATYLGQDLFCRSQTGRIGIWVLEDRGWRGAPRLFASATGLAPVRRTYQSYDWTSCLSTPSRVFRDRQC